MLYCVAPPGEDEKQFEQIGCKVQTELIDAEGKETKRKDKVHGRQVAVWFVICFQLSLINF